MAGTKINDLTGATAGADTDEFPLERAGANLKITRKLIRQAPNTTNAAGDVLTYVAGSTTDFVPQNPRWRILTAGTEYSSTVPTLPITGVSAAPIGMVTCVNHRLHTGVHVTLSGIGGMAATVAGNSVSLDGTFTADPSTFLITNATNAAPIVITVVPGIHPFLAGDEVRIEDVQGNEAANNTNANPSWTVASVSNATITLESAAIGNGSYRANTGRISWADKFRIGQMVNSSRLAITNATVSGSGATINITAVAGVITNATLSSGGIGYPASATFTLGITGGGGTFGSVSVSTSAGGVITSVTATPVYGGAGYSTTSSAATDSAATTITITTTSAHGFKDYDRVIVRGILGMTEANNGIVNDDWMIKQVTTTTMVLIDSVYVSPHTWTSGGTVELLFGNKIGDVVTSGTYTANTGTMIRPGRITLIGASTKSEAQALGFYKGYPLRMKTSVRTTYGIIGSIPGTPGYPVYIEVHLPNNAANELTFAGPPLTVGTLTELAIGTPDMVEVLVMGANKLPYYGSRTDLPLSQLIQGDPADLIDKWRMTNGGATVLGRFGKWSFRWLGANAFMAAYGIIARANQSKGVLDVFSASDATITADKDRPYNSAGQHTDGHTGKGAIVTRAASAFFPLGDRNSGMRGQWFHKMDATGLIISETSQIAEGGYAPALLLADIVDATNATPIIITTALGHGLSTGCKVTILGVTGNTAANVTANAIYVIDGFRFSLNGTVGNGTYGGVKATTAITGVTGKKPILTVSMANPGVVNVTAHGFSTNDTVEVQAVSGAEPSSSVNNPHIITVVDANNFSIPLNVTTAGTRGTVYKYPMVVTSVAHGLTTNDYVVIDGVLGNTGANGFWKVTVLTADTFSIANFAGVSGTSTPATGVYSGGGTVSKKGGFVKNGLAGDSLILESMTMSGAAGTKWRTEDMVQSPSINIDIGGQEVCTNDFYRGLRMDRTSTIVPTYNEPAEINELSYDVEMHSRIEVSCTSLGNRPGVPDSEDETLGGSQFLTVYLIFVHQ